MRLLPRKCLRCGICGSSESLSCLSSHRFAQGELICSSGDRLDKLHILERGIVELCQIHDAADCSVLLLSAGDLLFPAAGLFNEPCLTSVRAITPVRTVALEIETVKAEAHRNPAVAMELSRVVGGQWRMAVRHILDLRCRSVPQSLAKFLLRLVDESSLPDEAELPFSKGAWPRALAPAQRPFPVPFNRSLDDRTAIRGRKIILRDRSLVTRFCEPSLYPGEDEKRTKGARLLTFANFVHPCRGFTGNAVKF